MRAVAPGPVRRLASSAIHWRRATACLGLAFAGTAPVPAADWPHLRGPAYDGGVAAPALEGAASLGFEVAWRRPLGSGYASVVVSGGTAVTAAALDGRDVVIALEVLSGEELWRVDLAPVFTGRSGSDDGPSATPVIAAGRVFALDPAGRFVALELASGRLLWEKDLARDFGATMPLYGFSPNPLATAERVVVQAGGSEGRFVVALDAATGAVAWTAGDDAMEHQNPTLWDGPGGRQVVAPGVGTVAGYRLDDGALLWQHAREGRAHAEDVVVVDGRRLLVHSYDRESLLLEVTAAAGGGAMPLVAREVWRTRSFDNTYAIPVVHGDTVFGFDGQFLTSIELATGRQLWKSRPPTGQALTRVGDHLYTVSDRGDLVAVAAAADGYRESGRLRLFGERHVFTPVTYSDGLLFARNLDEVVAVRPSGSRAVAAPAVATLAAPAPRFLESLRAEVGDARLAAELVARHPRFPVVADGRVHFVWLGDEPDLALRGDQTGNLEVPLDVLPGTGIRYLSFDLVEGERWEYTFLVFEEERVDPRNPERVAIPGDAERSVVELPGYVAPAIPSPREGAARGQLDAVEVESRMPGRRYRMAVYTPPGYDPQGAPLPWLLVAFGAEAQRFAGMVDVLDAMAGTEIEPLAVVFLELPDAAWYEQNRVRFREILDQDLMPHLEQHYRLSAEPADRAVWASGYAVENALLWAVGSGIGQFASSSPLFAEHALERVHGPALAAAPKMTFRLDWGRSDWRNPHFGWDIDRQSRELVERLRAAGHDVTSARSPGGSTWSRFRREIPAMLRAFFGR